MTSLRRLLGGLLPQRPSPDEWITGDRARELAAEGALIVDVRSPREYAGGHVPGAVNVPVDEVASRVEELRQGRPLVLYCTAGVRSRKALRILAEAGIGPLYELGAVDRW